MKKSTIFMVGLMLSTIGSGSDAQENIKPLQNIDVIREAVSKLEIKADQNAILPYGYLAGLKLTWMSGMHIEVGQGVAKDLTNQYDIELIQSLLKAINCSWQAGNGSCGLAPGLTVSANETYHIFVMMNDTLQVDVGFDTDVEGIRLAYYTGYTILRRVGSIYTTNNSNIVEFIHTGDEFLLKKPVQITINSPTSSRFMIDVSVPKQVSVNAILSLFLNRNDESGGTAGVLFTSPLQDDTGGVRDLATLSASRLASTRANLRTNSAQIQTYINEGLDYINLITVTTHGWVDHRDRL